MQKTKKSKLPPLSRRKTSTQRPKKPFPWKKPTIIVLSLLVVFFSAPWWNPVLFPPVKNPVMGVSFSEKRSKEMGLDWQANYTALLDDMEISAYRLMSYWDIHESTRGEYDFSSLDWQMDEAAKRDATVSLAIGLRQPRWPECHQPEWAATLNEREWKQAVYGYIETVVSRYDDHPSLISWQLENEGMNDWFGLCGPADRQRLIEEYELVSSLSEKPIWMSLSDQHGLPLGEPRPDKWGYSVYRTVWSENTKPFRGYVTYPTPIWYHNLRADIIKLTRDRDIFIHELQLEPWGPRDTTLLSREEQDKSMDQEQIKESIYFARMIGEEDIYTWGGEWWYWRMVAKDDPSIWHTVKNEFSALRSD